MYRTWAQKDLTNILWTFIQQSESVFERENKNNKPFLYSEKLSWYLKQMIIFLFPEKSMISKNVPWVFQTLCHRTEWKDTCYHQKRQKRIDLFQFVIKTVKREKLLYMQNISFGHFLIEKEKKPKLNLDQNWRKT